MPKNKFEFKMTPTVRQLKRFILQIEHEVLGNLTEYWKDEARIVLIGEIARMFATEGYGSWARLKPPYARQKAKTHPGKTILRREDNYFQAATDENAPGNFHNYRPDFMEWGINLDYFTRAFGFPYPIVHERGGANHPARPVFELLDETNIGNELVFALGKHIQKRAEQEAKRIFS